MTDKTSIVPLENPNPVELFKPQGLDTIIARIEEEARSLVPDLDTDKGRKEIASVAARVSRSKTYLDGVGKEYVTELKKASKEVDEVRRDMRTRLDALRDEVRKPLTDWEEEQARIEREILARINGFDQFHAENLEDVKNALAHLEQTPIDESFGKHQGFAAIQKDKICTRLRAEIHAAEERIREEEERAKREAAERAEREKAAQKAREEAEEAARLKAEREAKRKQAEAVKAAKERERRKAEREAQAKLKAERERLQQEQQARIDEQKRKAREAQKRLNDEHQRKLAEQKKAMEAKLEAQRKKIQEEERRKLSEEVERKAREARERGEQMQRNAQAREAASSDQRSLTRVLELSRTVVTFLNEPDYAPEMLPPGMHEALVMLARYIK